MSRETSRSKLTRRELMDTMNIPKPKRGAFIRFCRHGTGDIYNRQAYFWDESRLKWGAYAPVEDRSRVFKTMKQMWSIYNN